MNREQEELARERYDAWAAEQHAKREREDAEAAERKRRFITGSLRRRSPSLEHPPIVPDAEVRADKERRRLESKARSFQPNAQMEQAIKLRDSQRPHDNAKYDSMGPSVKMSVGYYEEAKRAASELGLPTSAA